MKNTVTTVVALIVLVAFIIVGLLFALVGALAHVVYDGLQEGWRTVDDVLNWASSKAEKS